jgi:predicted metal-dependent HD superfamily phosphohydrolase
LRLRDDLAGAQGVKQAYHAANPVDAQLAVDLLASEGIQAHVQGNFLAGAAGELPVGELLRVWVAEADVARAKALLAERERNVGSLAPGALDPLFERSWQRTWRGLGARGEGLGLRDELLEAWSQPQRHYHTLRHLHDCLGLFEGAADAAAHPAEVEMALWFHDAVYDPRAADNEQRSADWAQRALAEAGVAPGSSARVCALVMATRHAVEPKGADEQLLVDVDLSILGADRERFEEYEVEVREEYAWVPGPVFRHKRRQILEEFMARRRIFSTPAFAGRLEQDARANLARAHAALKPWWQLW